MLEISLDGRAAVVTGAGQGLGWAYAQALAAAGASVVVNDVDQAAAEKAAIEIEDTGARAIAVAGDVGDSTFADRLVADTVSAYGSVDILVTNAGISRPNMLWNLTDDQWHDVLHVNLDGVFFPLRAAARRMRDAGYGRIVNVTSAAGIDGSIGQINYAAAKAAVIGITKSAARELAGRGICVNAIAPVAATPMTDKVRADPGLRDKIMARIPMRRYAEPDEVAPAVVFLASEAASYMTGSVMLVDGGLSM